MQQQNERARTAEVPREQPLAVWHLDRTRRTESLPRELARAAIAHYTDPGDLVLVPKLRRGELLQTGAALGRRALPLPPNAAKAENVIPLRPNASAALVLAPLGARTSERRLAQVPSKLLPLLRPGGFLALARGTRGTDAGALGHVVRTCQQSGLQYWQHVIALTPERAASDASGAHAEVACTSRGLTEDRAVRCHYDLLVFRRPADAIADTTVAAAEAVAA